MKGDTKRRSAKPGDVPEMEGAPWRHDRRRDVTTDAVTSQWGASAKGRRSAGRWRKSTTCCAETEKRQTKKKQNKRTSTDNVTKKKKPQTAKTIWLPKRKNQLAGPAGETEPVALFLFIDFFPFFFCFFNVKEKVSFTGIELTIAK